MKKSTIWLLIAVMAITFGGLVYIQIMYMDRMTRMRSQQFDESVRRSLYGVAYELERAETLHYLEQDIADLQEVEAAFLPSMPDSSTIADVPILGTGNENISLKYMQMQDAIRRQYLYQRDLLNELILTIMRQGAIRPVMERADSAMLRSAIRQQLDIQGVQLPFEFEVSSGKIPVYSTPGFPEAREDNTFQQVLFGASPTHYLLRVTFPTKGDYIYHSVRWLIPTLAFTLILLLIFLYTIISAFRQKKLSEMKTDFINNMTHEYKTPISTISLAGQMLADPSVRKSPEMLAHISRVITDESSRLRFQVDKVLQMSMFDGRGPNLQLVPVDADSIIRKVVSTFKLRVEKVGGRLDMDLKAVHAEVDVDQMHFTNVIFNLLDNALKYRREDESLHLRVETLNPTPSRLQIRIRDNGIGISRQHLRRIFTKFYRVPTGNRHDVKGFGLGLAYVAGLIHSFHGTVKAESTPGVGTTFIITLPLSSSKQK